MPRPCKKRRICARPSCLQFGPLGGGSPTEPAVFMTLDEYECIRRMDYEGLTQQQCAAQMDVARTTIQGIYSSARQKIAFCLVNGCPLRLEGGNVILCEKKAHCRKHCCGNQKKKSEDIQMKIGVTYENGQIYQHFGHTQFFKVYDIQDNKIVQSAVVDTNGQGHGALAGFLQEYQVDTLICGGIGGGAQNALNAAGIRLFCGVSGDADSAVEALLRGELEYSTEANCSHHEHHGHDHACGDHGCHH